MKRYSEAEAGNRRHWDELAEVHMGSYDMASLLGGGHVMDDMQISEMGEVRGRSMLHLQCHIGTDTLSWARLGAEVTGVDLSPVSLEKARELSRRTGLNAHFMESSVYGLPGVLDGEFDIVYTSVGVLCWLSDLDEWARIIHRYLKPGGVFYMLESHPFLNVFDDEGEGLSVRYPYFHDETPTVWPGNYPDYSDGEYMVRSGSWEWTWALSDVISALTNAGLRLEFLHEHDSVPWKALPCLVPDPVESGWFRLPEGKDLLPLTFSIRARRPL